MKPDHVSLSSLIPKVTSLAETAPAADPAKTVTTGDPVATANLADVRDVLAGKLDLLEAKITELISITEKINGRIESLQTSTEAAEQALVDDIPAETETA